MITMILSRGGMRNAQLTLLSLLCCRKAEQWPQKLIMQLIPQQLLVSEMYVISEGNV